MKTKMTKQIGLRVSQEQFEALQRLSKSTGLDASIIIRKALIEVLDNWEQTGTITFKLRQAKERK